MLRADPPRARRFASGLEPGDQRIARLSTTSLSTTSRAIQALHPAAGEPATRDTAAPSRQCNEGRLQQFSARPNRSPRLATAAPPRAPCTTALGVMAALPFVRQLHPQAADPRDRRQSPSPAAAWPHRRSQPQRGRTLSQPSAKPIRPPCTVAITRADGHERNCPERRPRPVEGHRQHRKAEVVECGVGDEQAGQEKPCRDPIATIEGDVLRAVAFGIEGIDERWGEQRERGPGKKHVADREDEGIGQRPLHPPHQFRAVILADDRTDSTGEGEDNPKGDRRNAGR